MDEIIEEGGREAEEIPGRARRASGAKRKELRRAGEETEPGGGRERGREEGTAEKKRRRTRKRTGAVNIALTLFAFLTGPVVSS